MVKHYQQLEREKARALRRTQWWQGLLQAGRCHYCGTEVGRQALTVDHIVPLARGGRSTRGNMVPACKPCNSAKKWQTPVEIALGQNRQPSLGDLAELHEVAEQQ
jgi:5-methylcytosine-specific restriction enzyme A